MIERRQFLEDAYFAPPDKSAAAPKEKPAQDAIIESVKLAVKAALEQGNEIDGSTVLELYVKMMRSSNQRRVTNFAAARMKKRRDFGTNELKRQFRIDDKTMPTTMRILVESAEKLGIKTYETTNSLGRGRYKRYMMFKPPAKPSNTPEETSKKRIKWDTAVFGRIAKNLEFIPSRYHEIALYLALCSKHINWMTYDEVSDATGFKKDAIRKYLKALEKPFKKIGVKLMINKSKVQGKIFIGVALKDNDNKMKNAFKKLEEKRQSGNQPAINKPKRQKRSSKGLGYTTAEVVLLNWDRRKPLDEWYDEPIAPRKVED